MTSTNTPHRKPRRMAREVQPAPSEVERAQRGIPTSPASPASPASPSRLDQLAALLLREQGATIAEMVEATGWQQHSVRGAMAGALKKRGLTITSQKTDGTRRYRAERPA